MKEILKKTSSILSWREKLLSKVKGDYFSLVDDNWSDDCSVEDVKTNKEKEFSLYTITPSMIGIYSIAEVVEDANKIPHRTLFTFLEEEGQKFTKDQIKSLQSISNLIECKGVKIFKNLNDIAKFLNDKINN